MRDHYNLKLIASVLSSGWTVTLAGTYGEDMAPDVEMRLSFPKKSPPPPSSSYKVYKFPSHQKSNYFNESSSHRDHGIYDDYTNGHPALLPPSSTYNPKRSLSRSVMDGKKSPAIAMNYKPSLKYV